MRTFFFDKDASESAKKAGDDLPAMKKITVKKSRSLALAFAEMMITAKRSFLSSAI